MQSLKELFKYEFDKVNMPKAHRAKVLQHTTVHIFLGCSLKSIGLDLTSKALDMEISLSAYFYLFHIDSGILLKALQNISCVVSHFLPPSARNTCAVMPPVK